MKPGWRDRARRAALLARALFHPQQIERDLEDEMSFHLALDGSERARSEATKEAYREAGDLYGMQMLARDVRYGARLLRRSPLFTAVAVATLGLGIGLNVALFSVVNAVLLQPLPFPRPQELVTLASSSAAQHNSGQNVGWTTAEDWRQMNHSFRSIGTYGWWSPTRTASGGDPQILRGQQASADFFPTLGVGMELGRNFTAAEDRPHQNHVVIVSDAYWRQALGGRRGVLAESLELNGTAYAIVGVLPPWFDSAPFRQGVQVWSPEGLDASLPEACRACQHLQAIGRLAPGVGVARARADMDAVERRLAATYPNELPRDATVAIHSLRDSVVGSAGGALWLLLGATGLVLLIACGNLASLMLARAAQRQREMAVRVAMGAGRMRLIRQLLTEGMLLGAMGGGLGLLLAELGLGGLRAWAAAILPRMQYVRLDATVLAFALGLSLLAGALVAVVPALRAARTEPAEVLHSTRGSLGTAAGPRRVLVACEMALAVVLAVAAGLVLKSFVRASAVAPGFDPEHVAVADYAPNGAGYADAAARVRFTQQVLERLAAQPRIESAGVVSVLPLEPGNYDTRPYRTQDPPRTTVAAVEAANAFYDTYFVSPGYFAAMGIRLRRGRLFTSEDMQHPGQAAIISESLARRLWPGRDPVGQALAMVLSQNDLGDWARVVGVVEDVHQYGLDQPATPEVYEPYTLRGGGAGTLVVRSLAPASDVRGMIEGAVWGLDRNVPITGPRAMQTYVAGALGQRRLLLELIGLFGALALGLAALGIYGVVAYTTAQRSSEIAMRLALGADRAQILRLVLDGGMRPALAGLAAGTLAALAAGGVLRQFTFGISAADPATFALVVGGLALVASGACLLPAWRASQLDPALCLRGN